MNFHRFQFQLGNDQKLNNTFYFINNLLSSVSHSRIFLCDTIGNFPPEFIKISQTGFNYFPFSAKISIECEISSTEK